MTPAATVLIPRLFAGHPGVGTVRRVFGSGAVHEVELSDGRVIPCMGDVLLPAPDNVVVFKRKEPCLSS